MKEDEFLSITIKFTREYYTAAEEIGLSILAGRIVDKVLLEKKIVAKMSPIISDYFNMAIAKSNKVVKAEISLLTDQLGVPFKYNKMLLDTINDKSIFNGYYGGKSLFTKREIANLKSVILRINYSDLKGSDMIKAIKSVVNVTNQRALVIGRTETTRLKSVGNKIYFGKKAVRDKYDLIFHSEPGARKEHSSYNGKKADKNGMFQGDCGLINGPPVPCPNPFNCRCSTEFIKKVKKNRK